MTEYDRDLFGVWSNSGGGLVFTLTLQPDFQYLQIWDNGAVQHGGLWKTLLVGQQLFLVLTLQDATPLQDQGPFGWQPALVGVQKFWAVWVLDGKVLRLYGADLQKVSTFTVDQAAVPSPPAVAWPTAPRVPVAPPAIQPTTTTAPLAVPGAASDQVRAIYQAIYEQDKATSDSIAAAQAAQTKIELDAMKSASDSLTAVIHAGTERMIGIVSIPTVSPTPPRRR